MIDDKLGDREDREIADALQTVGIEVNSVYDLVNTDEDYPAAIPVLLGVLPSLQEDRVKEGVVRALTVKEARSVAVRPLFEEFYAIENDRYGMKWVIGNALSVVADREHVDEMLAIVQDRSHGMARQQLVYGLGRFRGRADIVDVLTGLLGDDDVAAHALTALRRLKAQEARSAVEPLLDHPRPLIRREARKTLYALDKALKKEVEGSAHGGPPCFASGRFICRWGCRCLVASTGGA